MAAIPLTTRVATLPVIAALALGAGRLGAQAPEPPVPIQHALRDADGDGVPDRLGDTIVVTGVALSAVRVIDDDVALAPILDRSGGLVLFSRDSTILAGIRRGDSIRARGVVWQYRGQEELLTQTVERLGAVGAPRPREVLAADIQDEALEGRLVHVRGTLESRADANGSMEIVLHDRSGSIPIVVSGEWLNDQRLLKRLAQGGRAEVVGIVNQRTDPSATEGGYRLVPRDAADITFAPVPPYRLLGIVAVVVVVLVLGWWRARAARRARQLGRLTAELERSRDELRAGEERFRSLVENAADAIAVLGPHGELQYLSPSIEPMVGWRPDELSAESIYRLLHPDDIEKAAAALGRVREGGERSTRTDLRMRAADEVWHHLEVVLTNRSDDAAVRGIVCNVRDITEQRELQQRVRDADRMEAVGRLAGGIAHDFNNVLTALGGHAVLALESMPMESAGRTEVEEIARAAERAASLTRQLLAFSRQQVMQLQVVSPAAVVAAMVPMLRRLIGEDIELRSEAAPDLGRVRVDPAQLEQVVMNLVVNARDAMPDGGRVVIALENDSITDSTADRFPYAVQPGLYVRLSVSDTGHGMPPAVLAHIFEPFFTTKEVGRGTGLGLATLYGIVKQSDGYIWATSDPGQGSRFDVFFPRVDAADGTEALDGTHETDRQEPEAAPAPAPATPAPGTGETVLLVEDEAAVRRLARRVLEKAGYRIVEAGTPAAALHAMADVRIAVDLLLTDVVMPGMNGRQLAERLRQGRPDLKVLFMSGYTEDQVMRYGIGSGEVPFLGKPYTPAQLLESVRQTLA